MECTARQFETTVEVGGLPIVVDGIEVGKFETTVEVRGLKIVVGGVEVGRSETTSVEVGDLRFVIDGVEVGTQDEAILDSMRGSGPSLTSIQ